MTRRQLAAAVIGAAAVLLATATIRSAYDAGHVVGSSRALAATRRRLGVVAWLDVVDELAGAGGSR